MTAVEKMYGRWGNYIPTDIRKQFEKDCLEAEKQIAELKAKNVGMALTVVERQKQIAELEAENELLSNVGGNAELIRVLKKQVEEYSGLIEKGIEFNNDQVWVDKAEQVLKELNNTKNEED